MRQQNIFFVFIFSLITCVACRQGASVHHTVDVKRFAKEKCLYAALEGNFNDYFLFNGHPMGFGLELLEGFSSHLGCELVVLPCRTLDEQWQMLEHGRVDIIASDLDITEERLEKAAFTHPLYQTEQVLVQLDTSYSGNRANFISSMEDLSGKTVTVRKNSVFEEFVRQYDLNLTPESRIRIESSSRTEEELMHDVAVGEIPFTVVSRSKAIRFKMAHPQIDHSLTIGRTQTVAWALNLQADSLLLLANRWIDSMQQNKIIPYLYHKYYEIPIEKTVRSTKSGFRKIDSVNRVRKQDLWENLLAEGVLSHEDSLFFFEESPRSFKEKHMHGNVEISPFDRLLKKYSRQIGWDWRLLASLVYQESQFQNHLVSSKGAIGLMQLMPATAKQYGINMRSTDAEQIAAGIKYIKSLYRSLPEEIPEDQQVYFVLAAYNIGLGHVLDARRLAAKYGANPNLWQNNVETYLRLKSQPEYYRDSVCRNGYANGRQATDFVRKIKTRYRHYLSLTYH